MDWTSQFPFTSLSSLPPRGELCGKVKEWDAAHNLANEALFNEQFLFNYVTKSDLTFAPVRRENQLQEDWTVTNSKNFRLLTLEKIEQTLFDEYFAHHHSPFDSLLKKRLALLMVILFPNSKFGVGPTPLAPPIPFPEEESQTGVPKLTPGLSPSVQICTMMFIPLIKSISRADPSIYSASLTSLQMLLDSASPLALRAEPKVVLNAIQEFLDSLISGESSIDLENKKKVFDLLLTTGVTFGTLSSWLSVMKATLSSKNQDVFPLVNISKLSVLAEHQTSFTLSPPKGGEFFILSCPTMDVSSFLSLTRIATDGSYIFIHNGTHIIKMGTGYQQTLAGHVYRHDSLEGDEIRTEDDFWFVCLGAHLFAGTGLSYTSWRCADPKPAPSAKFDLPMPSDLAEEGSQLTLQTVISDGSRLFVVSRHKNAEGPRPEAVVEGTLEPEKSQRVPSSERIHEVEKELSPSPSDSDQFEQGADEGDFFEIRHKTRPKVIEDISLRVDIYEPVVQEDSGDLTLRWSQKVVLNAWSTDVQLSQAMVSGSEYYTNGYKLAIVHPVIGGEENTQHFKLFDLQNGLQENDVSLPDSFSSSKAYCFDTRNNVTWSLTHDFGLITSYNNLASAVPTSSLYSDFGERRATDFHYSCTSIISRPEYLYFSKGGHDALGFVPPPPLLNQEQTALFILAHIERLLSQNTNSLPDLEFAMEISPRAFASLLWLVELASKRQDTLSRHGRCYMILGVLRVLKHNLFQAVSYQPSPPFLVASQPDQEISMGSKIRDLALRLFFRPKETLEGELDSAKIYKLLKEEAAEILGVAAPFFFPDAESRATFMRTLFDSDSQPSPDQPTSNTLLFCNALSRLASAYGALDLFSFLGKPGEPLIDGLLSSIAQTEHALLKAFQDSGRFEETARRKHHYNLTLISDYQRKLFQQFFTGLNDPSKAQIPFPCVKDFVLKVIQASYTTLGIATKIVANFEPPATDSFLGDLKEVTLLGHVVPTLSTSLFFLSSQTDLLSPLVNELVTLFQAIARVTEGSEEMKASEKRYLDLCLQFASHQDSKLVGTRHPYRGGGSQTKEVLISRARYLLLSFDPRSEFPFYSDQLTLYSNRDQETQIGNPIFYTCPNELLFVPGDSIFFKFEPSSLNYDAREAGWGYECLVHGFVPEHCLNLHWMLDLKKSLSCFLGHAVQVMTRQPKQLLTKSPQEKECLEWLQSSLLSNVHQPKRFLDSELEGLLTALVEDPTSHIALYHQEMKEKASKGRPVLLSRLQLEAEETAEIDHTYALFLATLLKHCSQLSKLASSLEKVTGQQSLGSETEEDLEMEDQFGELGGDSRSHSAADSMSHKSLWKFSLKLLDYLGQRRQDIRSSTEGDDAAISKSFLEFLRKVQTRIRFLFALNPIGQDLSQPVTTPSPLSPSKSGPASPRGRASSFDAASLSPQASFHSTAMAIRRSTSSYNQVKLLAKKKLNPSVLTAQQILQFVESSLDPSQLEKVVQETARSGKLRLSAYGVMNRLLHTETEASVHQDLLALFAGGNLCGWFDLPPPSQTLMAYMAAQPQPAPAGATVPSRLPGPFFPNPVHSVLVTTTTPEAILLQAKKEQGQPAPQPEGLSSVASSSSSNLGLQSASTSSLITVQASIPAPLVLESEYSYARGLLACPESLLKELRTRYLEIIKWTLETLSNQANEPVKRLASIDLLISRLHSSDFHIFNQLDGMKTLFATLDSAEEVLLAKNTPTERDENRWLMKLHKKVFNAVKYLFLYSTQEYATLAQGSKGHPDRERDLAVLLAFQKSLFGHLLKSLEIQARRFIKKSKKLSDGYWDSLQKTMNTFGGKAMRDGPPLSRPAPADGTSQPEEISAEAYTLLFADSFCYERISLFMTVFVEINPEARSINDASFLSMMLIRLLSSGYASPRVSLLLPRLLGYLMPRENPDDIFELLKGHGMNSKMFNFTVAAVEKLPAKISPFLQMAFTMLSHLTRPAQGEFLAEVAEPSAAENSGESTARAGSPDSQSEATASVTSQTGLDIEPAVSSSPRPLEVTRLRESNKSTESVASIESTGLGRLVTLWSMTLREKDDDEESSKVEEKVGFLTWSSHERFSLASELVAFLRALASGKEGASWRRNIMRGLQTTLETLSLVPDLVKTGIDPEIPALILANAESALMVLGGFLEPIRTGGQVVVLATSEGHPLLSTSQEKGVVVYYDGCDTTAGIFSADCQTRHKISQLAAIPQVDADADWIEFTPAVFASINGLLQAGSPLWHYFGSAIMPEVRLCLLRALEVLLKSARNARAFLEGDGFATISQLAISQTGARNEKIQPHEYLHLYTTARETPTQVEAAQQLNNESLATLFHTLPCSPVLPLLFAPTSPGQDEPPKVLPTRLVTKDSVDLIEIGDDGLTAVYHGPGIKDDDVGVVTSNEPFHSLLPLIYYEVKIQNSGTSSAIGIGLIERGHSAHGMPGWHDGAYGYHGDDGLKFMAKYFDHGRDYSTIFTTGDVIGCGMFAHSIFFTKNGKHLGDAFKGIAHEPTDLFAMIGLHTDGEPQIKVNFGQTPFVFDISHFVMKEQGVRNPKLVGAPDDEDGEKATSERGSTAGENDDEDSDDSDEEAKKKVKVDKGKARERSEPSPKKTRVSRLSSSDNAIPEEDEKVETTDHEDSGDEEEEEEEEEEKDADDDSGEEDDEKPVSAPSKKEGQFESYLRGRLKKLEISAKVTKQSKSTKKSTSESDEGDGSGSESEESWHTVEEDDNPEEGDAADDDEEGEGEEEEEEEEEEDDDDNDDDTKDPTANGSLVDLLFDLTEAPNDKEGDGESKGAEGSDVDFSHKDSDDDLSSTSDSSSASSDSGESESEGSDSTDLDDEDGSEASGYSRRRSQRRRGRGLNVRQIQIGDLLRVTEPLDLPALSFTFECYGLDARKGLVGLIGRVLKVDVASGKLLLGFSITPQGLWFSLWLTPYQVDLLSLGGGGVKKEQQMLSNLTMTLTHLIAQNVALQLLSKVSRDVSNLGASLRGSDVKSQSASFLRFLKSTVSSLVPLSTRYDDVPRDSADAWTGELENRLFGVSSAAPAHTTDPKTPQLSRRRRSVTWLEAEPKTFTSQHLFPEIDLKLETLSSKDYNIWALKICRDVLIRIIAQEYHVAKAKSIVPGKVIAPGTFAAAFLDSVVETFSAPGKGEQLEVYKGESTQELPEGAFSEVLKIDATGLKPPLMVTFVSKYCEIDFAQDQVSVFQSDDLDSTPIKVFGKDGCQFWHTFLVPSNRFSIKITKVSEDSRQGIKFMAFSMSKIVSNAKSASLEMKNKFAYGWWSLQAVMTPELDKLTKEGCDFPLYDVGIYDCLSNFVLTLPASFSLKGESYHLLSRYLSTADSHRHQGPESRGVTHFNLGRFSKLWEKLKNTRNELYDDYPDGHALLQSLTELFLTVRKVVEGNFTSEKEREKVKDTRYLFGLTQSPKKKATFRENGDDDDAALHWMDGLYLAIDFLVNVDHLKPLSSLLIERAILHTVPPTAVVESSHPYSLADEVQKLEIHSEDTQSLQVVFDPKSNTNRADVLTIKSLGKSKEGEEHFQFYGSFGERRVPFQCSDVTYSFKMAPLQEYVHYGVRCDMCNTTPIKGPRFKCINCIDFDICQDCEGESHTHNPHHVFFKVVRPLLPADERPSALIPHISDQEITDKTEPWECSKCLMKPIVGPKWICGNCDKLTVLCNNCEKTVAPVHFGGLHSWIKFHKNPSINPEPKRNPPLMPNLYSATQYWGYKFRIIPELTNKGKKKFLKSKKRSMISSNWDHQSVSIIINQMVEFINEWLDRQNLDTNKLETTDVSDIIATLRDPQDPLKAAHHFPLLLTLDEQHVEFICAVILQFNISLSKLLYVLEPRNFQVAKTIGKLVTQHKSFVLLTIKLGILVKLIENTYVDKISPTVRLNRQEAANKLPFEEGEAIKNSIFLQMYRQLKDVSSDRFRQEEQSWTVKFFNEGAEDAGGPYRESLVLVCAELQSPLLPLFILCPNAKEGTGENRDKYIPNPDCTDPTFLQMYFFIGKLMGIAVRTKTVLDLDLPSFIWKPMVGEEQTVADLEAIDLNFVQFSIKSLENPEAAGISEESFSSVIFNNFVVTSASGKEVPLVENGQSIRVTWDNRLTYTKLALNHRLRECDKQIEALRKGIYEIIPPYIISLFSWKEVELRICGKTDVDVELLRKNTTYHGLTEQSSTITNFWKVFQSFTSEERCAFMRFVWGRSRLPASSAEFERKFEIHHFDRHVVDGEILNPDNFLPQAHTCFFSVEIPDYSTEEVMKKKLLYAISECVVIDTDYNPMEEDEDSDDYTPETSDEEDY